MPSARVRFIMFREDGGLYQPISNHGNYLIESSPLENDHFKLKMEGIKADEVFLTNAIAGIKWIYAFKQKHFCDNVSAFLTKKLNKKFNLISDSR